MLSISRRNFITLGAGLFATGALAGCGGGSSAEAVSYTHLDVYKRQARIETVRGVGYRLVER